MGRSINAAKKYIVRIVLILGIIFLISVMVSLPLERVLFAVDFTEYWSASRLLLNGDNPYSIDAMWRIQSELPDWPYEHPVKMYNPPWVLGIILPLGLLPYSAARLVWLFFGIVTILLCLDLCWRLYQGPKERRWVSWVTGISFLPTIGCLDLGQISFLVLLGICAFLYLMVEQKWFLAGCAALLMAIKPQLLVLCWLVLLLWVIHNRRWTVLAGMITAGVIILTMPLMLNPMIITQYLDFIHETPPFYYEVPTISFALRLLLDYNQIWLQYIPTFVGLGWIVWFWRRHYKHWDWLVHFPMVIVISLLVTSFAWTFDQVILLPLLIQAVVWVGGNLRKRWVFAAVYLLFYVVGLVQSLIVGTLPFWYVWQVPVLAGLYALVAKAMAGKEERPTNG